MRKILLTTAITVFITGCIHSPNSYAQESHQHKATEGSHARSDAEYTPYDMDANSMVDVDRALARARVRGTKALVVMGANWCHDSRGLAARFDRPEFKTLIADNYELVYVSVGDAKMQKDQNRAVSKRFGVDAIVGTPTVFIANPDGTVLNADSAGYWRRADSIPMDMTYAYFEMYAGK